jgi:hypothetical protein
MQVTCLGAGIVMLAELGLNTRAIIMKNYLAILLLVFSGSAFAQEYLLEISEQCGANGARLIFECGLSDEEKITGKKAKFIVFQSDGEWSAKQINEVIVAKFKTLQNDHNILILETSTPFSGNRTLYIFKKNQRFYLVEVAYTDTLKNNEITLKQGKVIKLDN